MVVPFTKTGNTEDGTTILKKVCLVLDMLSLRFQYEFKRSGHSDLKTMKEIWAGNI